MTVYMIYDTIFQCAGNHQQNSFVFKCMSVSEEFLEIRKLHLSPKQSSSMYKWGKKEKILEHLTTILQ